MAWSDRELSAAAYALVSLAPRLPPMLPRVPALHPRPRGPKKTVRLRAPTTDDGLALMISQDLLRRDWVARQKMYKRLCWHSPNIASMVGLLMSPDQLLDGRSTGVQPTKIICIRPLKRLRETHPIVVHTTSATAELRG